VVALDDEQRARIVTLNDVSIVPHPTARVQNDAHGALAGDEPSGESWIVQLDRRRSDDDGIEQRAHAVRMTEVLGPRDERRRAARRRHAPVEALPEMSDAQRRALRTDAQREIQVEELCRRVRDGPPWFPPSITVGRNDDPGVRLRHSCKLAALK
jgi:hypothetical protein